MRIAKVQFNSWDKQVNFDVEKLPETAVNDYLIVESSAGVEAGKVTEVFTEGNEQPENEAVAGKIIRRANAEDLQKLLQLDTEKDEALLMCKKLAEKNELPMKLVDAHFSFDGVRLTFAFTAASRIDFRKLVRDLTRQFTKNIRLQQLGIRDEIKVNDGIGPCGRRICCRAFLHDLGNISSELVECQQLSHRGAERLSGLCGRLRCCLSFEAKVYEELKKKMPPIGTVVKTPQGKGVVIGWQILKQAVNVRLEKEDSPMVEVNITELA